MLLERVRGIRIISNDILNVSQQRAIRKAANMLFMNIMEATTKGVHIQILQDDSKAVVSAGVQRMHAIAESMCRDTMTSLKNFDTSLARVVYSLDNDVDHLSFLVLRLLRSMRQTLLWQTTLVSTSLIVSTIKPLCIELSRLLTKRQISLGT